VGKQGVAPQILLSILPESGRKDMGMEVDNHRLILCQILLTVNQIYGQEIATSV
jgi:hypothetical protein